MINDIEIIEKIGRIANVNIRKNESFDDFWESEMCGYFATQGDNIVLLLRMRNISTFPVEICELKNLIELELYHTQFTSIPSSIGKLKNLEHLNLYNNQLTAIPERIGELKNLKKLYLDNNQLTVIPENIFDLNMKIKWRNDYSIGIT